MAIAIARVPHRGIRSTRALRPAVTVYFVGGVAQWLGRRSLAGSYLGGGA